MLEKIPAKETTELCIIKDWDHEDITYVRESLRSFNSQFISAIPFPKPQPVNLILKEEGLIIGGLLGNIYWQCCHVDFLWVDERYRKKNYGTKLMQKIEEIARENDCRFIHLDTLSFQASGFYKKCGYSVFGELDGYPDGIVRYYMKKELL